MIHKQLISACALMLLVLAGCDSGVVNVRALPTPEPGATTTNLPVQLHQRNWTGSLGKGAVFMPRLSTTSVGSIDSSLANAGERPMPTANGTRDCVIGWMLPASTTATRSRLILVSSIGQVQPGVEQSSGGSQRIAARSLAGSSVMGSNTQRSSTTTIRGASNSRLVNSSSAYGQATEALP